MIVAMRMSMMRMVMGMVTVSMVLVCMGMRMMGMLVSLAATTIGLAGRVACLRRMVVCVGIAHDEIISISACLSKCLSDKNSDKRCFWLEACTLRAPCDIAHTALMQSEAKRQASVHRPIVAYNRGKRVPLC